jgi:Ca2+-binding RTX toxin-like protein
MAIINGTSKNETLTGTNGPDSIAGGGGNDILFGLQGNDDLRGETGNDVLWGGDGNDTLKGGVGNDVYVVGSTGDVVDEEGNTDKDDLVRSSISVNLSTMFGGAIEHAHLTGSANIDATGNAADNKLTGNGGVNTLDGREGDDLLDGGTNRDSLLGDQGNDTLLGASGNDGLFGGDDNDLLRGGTGNDVLGGGEGNDILFGDDGNDRLVGNAGDDEMKGGKGNDVYIVDSTGDVATEISGQGIDEVRTKMTSHTLGSNLENLFFIGVPSEDFAGTGNVRANTIFGGDGSDTLRGESGNDKLNGLDGNDMLEGGTGNDNILGGVGIDAAIFSGKIAEYTITNVGGVITVKDKVTSNGNDGTDTLSDVEVLKFQDGQLFLDGTIDLATLDGTNGFRLIGIDSLDSSGISVSSAGDVNGDGLDDVIVGANGVGGESYVVFGQVSWTATPSLNLATLDGTNGFRLVGLDPNGNGVLSDHVVSSAGDVNGDGFDDIIVGAAGVPYGGVSHVVFGKASWAGTPSLDLSTLDGTDGFRIVGIDEFADSGSSVSSAGDINGDGFADLIVGTPNAGTPYSHYKNYNEGESYVVFGKADWSGTPSIGAGPGALDGTNGFVLFGADFYDYSGASVSSAGDVNGDGFADLIVGAPRAESEGGAEEEGESYVVFGKASWVGTPFLNLASLNGTNGFRLAGIDEDDLSATSVSTAGDVNGDGFDDLIIGAFSAESSGGDDEGESYVVFGKANWAGTPLLDLATLDGTNGFRLNGSDENDFSGYSVSSAGDVNGDGFADMIVGAHNAESFGGPDADAGESYVVYGKANWTGSPSLDLGTLDGADGFRLSGIDEDDVSGFSVSSAGDVNGDGFTDLIVGAPYAESAGGANSEGESYVVFGGNFSGAVTHLGGAGDDTLAGSAAAETFVGGNGKDTMIGNGGVDAFQGGAGDDIVRVSTLDFLVADGGTGSDTLELDGAGLHLDLTALADSRTRSIERIDIGGSGGNELTLSVLDVLNLSDVSNELLVLGDAGDAVNQGPGWTAAVSGGTNGNGTSTIGGQTYQIYNAGQATLLLDTDMTVTV